MDSRDRRMVRVQKMIDGYLWPEIWPLDRSILLATSLTAIRPEEHCRLRATKGTVSGIPATRQAARCSVAPAPAARTFPQTTSPMSLGSIDLGLLDETLKQRGEQLGRRGVLEETLTSLGVGGSVGGGDDHVVGVLGGDGVEALGGVLLELGGEVVESVHFEL